MIDVTAIRRECGKSISVLRWLGLSISIDWDVGAS